MQMFLFTPAEDLSLSFLTKTLCNRLSFLSTLISSFYKFLSLSSTSVRLSHSNLQLLDYVQPMGHLHSLYPNVPNSLPWPTPEKVDNTWVCAVKYTISSSFNYTQSWSPVVIHLVGTDRKVSRAVKFPLVNCCCRFIFPCFASAEVARVGVGQKWFSSHQDTTESSLCITYRYR